MFQIYSHFIVCDVIHVCCHSYLWCKVRHPMLGVIVFSIFFLWVIILIHVAFISLNCVIKFKTTFEKLKRKLHGKITYFNLSKCLGVPAFWRQNLRWFWGVNFYIWPSAYWNTILHLCYQGRFLTHQEVPEAKVMWNVPCRSIINK